MKNASKILIIGVGNEFGGVEQFIFSVCNKLKLQGYEFGFLLYKNVCELNKKKIVEISGEMYVVPQYSKNPLGFLNQIIKFYKTHPEYRIIHCHASHASIIMYTLPVWLKKDKKIIFHSHNANGKNILLHKVMRIIVNKVATRKIACSVKAAIWMFGKDKDVYIIYNGIEVDRYRFNSEKRSQLRNKYNIEEQMVFGHVGRFEEQKNHLFLIKIFEEILQHMPDACLILIGEGKLKDVIIGEINRRHLEKNIIILPFQDNIEDFYSAMDVFLLPSLYEGYPIVGVEIQASGLLSYLSDTITKEIKVSSLVEFIDSSWNENDWVKKIVEDVKKKEDSLKHRNKVYFSRKIAIDETIRQVESIYESV